MIPAGKTSEIQIVVENGGATYTNTTTKISAKSNVGESVALTKQ